MNPLTARALAILELAGNFIARADAQTTPDNPERREARARFLHATEIAIKIAGREPIYCDGLLLPPYPVWEDPRTAALEEVARTSKVDAQRLESRIAELLAESERGLGLVEQYMRTLPRATPGRPQSATPSRRCFAPVTRLAQLEGLDATHTAMLEPQ